VYRGRQSKPVSYKRHWFPPGIIAHAVWLSFRFPLSLPLVEEMLLERYVRVSYETVFRWALKFGPAYARRLRRKTPSRCDVWRLDSSPHRHGGMENRGQQRRLSLLGGRTGRHAPAVNVTTPAE
jgi:putative transposase